MAVAVLFPMNDFSGLLLKIPDEYKPIAAIGIGSFMLVFLAMFHGWGLQRILHRNKRGELRLRSGTSSLFEASLLFGWAVFLMMVLHLVEVVIWAVALVYMGLVPRIPNAMYFCANAYTTLGMGSLDLGEHWRILSPIIAISGLFTFAWTTSSLVDIVSTHTRLLEQLELERERPLKMRMAATEEAGRHGRGAWPGDREQPESTNALRQALNVEARLNDGLSLPFLLFFMVLAAAKVEGAAASLLQFIGKQLGLGRAGWNRDRPDGWLAVEHGTTSRLDGIVPADWSGDVAAALPAGS